MGDGTDEGDNLHAVRFWPARAVRGALLEAVLDCVGERGYGGVTLGDVIARAGTNNRAFHRHFASLADCFAEAYELAADELARRVLTAARRQDGWAAAYRAGLAAFLDFVKERPRLARALLVEYRAAGGPAAAKHADLTARLVRALDRGREPDAADRPPSFTPRLLIGAIEFSVAELIMGGRAQQSDQLAPSLSYLGVLLYCGQEAAREELGGEG